MIYVLLLELFLTFFNVFADISRPKADGRDMLHHKRAKAITLTRMQLYPRQKLQNTPSEMGREKEREKFLLLCHWRSSPIVKAYMSLTSLLLRVRVNIRILGLPIRSQNMMSYWHHRGKS